ncbi:MAG: CopD family protein, partial [Deltaproteobacteria bacterium]|nr:CopD family protein [Deltaproteobacteria bacterium]
MWLWRVLDTPDMLPLTACVWQRVRCGTLLGALGFVLSGYADMLRAASQVSDPTDHTVLWQFLVGTRYGHMTLLKSLLTPAFLMSFFLLSTSAQRLAQVCTALCGLALLTTLSLTSHAAAKPGVVPVVSDIVHLVAVAIWGGELLYFALLPWKTIRQDLDASRRLVWKLVERFSNVALVAVLLLVTSGAVMAFLHVYGIPAFSSTAYGRTLVRKIALLLLTLSVAGWQLMVLSPALKRQARAFVPIIAHALIGRCALLVRAEAAILVGVIVLAAVLTTLPPAERAAQVTHRSWEQRLDNWRLRLTMTPQGGMGQVQFDIALAHLHGQEPPRDTQVLVHLRMRDHAMGTSRRAATPVAAGQYTTPGLISMAGSWEVEVTIDPPGAAAITSTFGFEAAAGTRDQDRSRRLDLAAVQASPLDTLSCILGLLLGALATLTLWASRSGRMPLWATPFGLFLMACGGYLVLRTVLVDAYPTTYLKNPLLYSAEVINTGQALFQAHCTVCHGRDG